MKELLKSLKYARRLKVKHKELLRALKPFFTTQERERKEICFFLKELEKILNEISCQQGLIRHIKAYIKQVNGLEPDELRAELQKSLNKGEVIYAKIDILLTKAIYNREVYRFFGKYPETKEVIHFIF